MADMAALLVGYCLENVDMDGIRFKDLRDFKGYGFHSVTSSSEFPVPGYRCWIPGTGYHIPIGSLTLSNHSYKNRVIWAPAISDIFPRPAGEAVEGGARGDYFTMDGLKAGKMNWCWEILTPFF